MAEDAAPRERWAETVRLAISDIKLAHTVFALPFAVLTAFVVRPRARSSPGQVAPLDGPVASVPANPVPDWSHPTDWLPFSAQLVLIIACMFFARTWAMLVNRLADARFDVENPRTASRAVASGKLRPGRARLSALASACCFIACASGFVWASGTSWPIVLSVPVLAVLAAYSFAKRYSATAHLQLGIALAISPLCVLVAMGWSFAGLVSELWPLLLAGFVACWVAGFDIAYALADMGFDRRVGLHSIPARLGVRGALWVSRGLHVAAAAMIVWFAITAPTLGVITLVAAIGVCALLVYEHVVLARRGLAGLPVAFFTVNGVISLLFGLAGVIDTLSHAARLRWFG